MDLSLLQRSDKNDNIENDTQSQVLHKRPKLSFSVASLLASAARPRSPLLRPEEQNDNDVKDNNEEEEAGIDSDDESEVSVDSHGDDTALYNSRLNDSSDLDQDLSAPSPTSPGGPVSPPRSDIPNPRLAMPTPLLGGRLTLPGLLGQLPGMPPPGWPNILPPGLQGLNPALFKSGENCEH